ncbi:MAG: hypothetical protein ACQERO_05365 [Bacteroidota bacterium]
MQEKTENRTLSGIEDELKRFTETDLQRELEQARLDFREPLKEWFINTRNSIQRLKKDDENYYRDALDLFTSNLPDLQRIVENLHESSWSDSYKKAVLNAAESLPAEMTEDQGEVHLKPNKEDSLYVRSVKGMKRMRTKLSSRPLRRTVQVRQLALRHFLDNGEWIRDVAAREYDEIGMLVGLFLEKKDVEKENVPEKNQKAENGKEGRTNFAIRILNQLEEHLQIGVQHFKQLEENNSQQVNDLLREPVENLLKNASLAGTFQYSEKKGVGKERSTFPADLQEHLEGQHSVWLEYLNSQLSDITVQVEIARYSFVARDVQNKIRSLSHQFFRDSFYLPIERGVEETKQIIENLKQLSSKEKIDKELDQQRRELEENLREKLLEPMSEPDKLLKPVEKIRDVISSLQAESRRFSEELHLAEKRESAYPVPVLQMDKIKWQSLAARYLKEQAVKELDPKLQGFDELLALIYKDVQESARVVDINLLAAIESIRGEITESGEEEQDPLAIALEGMERAVTTLEKAIRQVRDKQNAYQTIVETGLPEALHSLAGTMLRREFDKFELQDKAILVKEQASDWQKRVRARWARYSEKVELGWRFLVRKFRVYRQITGRFLGFKGEEVISTKEKRNLAEYLARPGEARELPFVYKRLFDRDFEIDDRFYVSPDSNRAFITNAYEQWKRGLGTNVGVVGEKGSGKSTLIRFAKDVSFPDEEPIEITFETTFTEEEKLLSILCNALGFKPVENREEFFEKIERKKRPSVVIVENLQNLFVRNINGYDALEAFWVIMSATTHKLFWVVSVSRYSWEFFVKMSKADQYFSHITETDRLDEKGIRDAIMARHKASGYELYFEPGEMLKNSRAYKKLLDDDVKAQELVRDTFFSRLSKVSEGNLSIAMIFWLQSIKEYDSRRFVFTPLEVTEVDKLETPSKEVLFTLAALVIHDTLSQEQVAMALHQDLSESRLMLARLKSKGIIYKSKNGYNLNHLVYRQVLRMLKRRNIIH